MLTASALLAMRLDVTKALYLRDLLLTKRNGIRHQGLYHDGV